MLFVCAFVVMPWLCFGLVSCVCFCLVLRVAVAVIVGATKNNQTQTQTHIAIITRVLLLFDVLCCLFFVWLCSLVAVCVFVVCVCVVSVLLLLLWIMLSSGHARRLHKH